MTPEVSRERAVRLGDGRRLAGMFAEPARRPALGGTAAIMLDAGAVHRVGPFRLHVDLARRLAALGVPSLRFDPSGTGDSDAAAALATEDERAISELVRGCDLIESVAGARRVALIGMGAAADRAHLAVARERRIGALVLIDGPAYPTTRFRVRRWLHRTRGAADPTRAWPRRLDFAVRLGDFVERGGRLLAVFTGGAAGYYNYPEQLVDAVPPLEHPRVRVDYLPHVDRTVSRPADREALVDRIARWIAA